MAKKRANGEGSITKRPNGTWEGRITVDGKRQSFYGRTQREVKARMDEVKKKILTGTWLTPNDYTVEIWLKEWMDDYITPNVKPRTTERYWTDIRLHIVPYIGTVRLQDLTAPMLQKFINQCRSSGISAKSVRNLHGVLHEALAQAVRCELINKNVSELCLLPKAIKPEMHPLKDEKVKEFLEAIKGHRYEDMYFFMMFTGLRESEAIGLMWDCVDLERGKITVNKQLQKAHSGRGKVFFSTPKNGKSRTFTVAPSVIQVLKRVQVRQKEWQLKCGSKWQNDDNLVFTTELGKHVSCHTLYNNFKEIVRSIGVPETRLHDLRHTFATLALQNDVDIKTVSEMMGHATVAFTLDRYGHMTETMQQHASDRMQSFIDKLG